MVDISRTDVKLPLVVAIGWGIGTFVPSIMFNITNVFLMRFMTDVLGIAAVTAGAIFAISKIYDAVTDPVMGTISDRTRTRWGRHRPYLIFGGNCLRCVACRHIWPAGWCGWFNSSLVHARGAGVVFNGLHDI